MQVKQKFIPKRLKVEYNMMIIIDQFKKQTSKAVLQF